MQNTVDIAVYTKTLDSMLISEIGRQICRKPIGKSTFGLLISAMAR